VGIGDPGVRRKKIAHRHPHHSGTFTVARAGEGAWDYGRPPTRIFSVDYETTPAVTGDIYGPADWQEPDFCQAKLFHSKNHTDQAFGKISKSSRQVQNPNVSSIRDPAHPIT
jgi:hypothetical protein